MQTKNVTFVNLPQTIYGATLDVVSGELTVTEGYITSYNGETINEPWLSDRDEYVSGTTPTIGAEVVYPLSQPITYHLTPQEITLLVGENNVWSDGYVEVAYPTEIPQGEYSYLFDGIYEVTYHTEDECGNETTETRKVIVGNQAVVCDSKVCSAKVVCG